ncbi:hypothetical protein F0562_012190 [Nyssa sinensis]|uniref:PUM-HD domain-containing protein n=1 Tax=Nyssa sinensis TaxID=561372 RepID=A0A5J4ZST7_9ASTE|nr:hypothetical protein F0562_012190 [Nyssa sinensis]
MKNLLPSPSVVDLLYKRGEKDVIVGNGRRSVAIERQKDGRVSLPRAKVAPGDVSGHNDGATAVSERSSKSGVQERKRIKREESSGKKIGTDLIGGNEKPLLEGNDLVHDIDLWSSEPFKDQKIKHKGHREDVHLKTLSEQLNEVRMDGDDVVSSHIYCHGKHTQNEIIGEEAKTSICGYYSGLIRSLSRGLSNPRLKKGGSLPRGRDVSDTLVISDQSSSSTKSEALPLLVEASGSQGSTDNAAWMHDYSRELGIFADNLLKHEIDFELASEARSGDQRRFRGHRSGRHQNMTQKYMPRTFRDLVGQNLVAQALSNAVMRRKHVLEHEKPLERYAIINKLMGQIIQMSQQKFASNVVKKCLTFGTPVEHQILVNEILGSTDENEPLQLGDDERPVCKLCCTESAGDL